jgi:hypothetical protein
VGKGGPVQRLPDDLLCVENPQSGEKLRVVPGELRTRHVKVGRHVLVDPDDIPAFPPPFRGRVQRPHVQKVIGVAAAHPLAGALFLRHGVSATLRY